MKKKTIIILITLSVLSLNLFGQVQNGEVIVGRVSSLETGEPLTGVNIYLENTTYGAASNGKGEYKILNVPPGEYNLVATYIGFKNFYKEIVIKRDQVFHLDIGMEMASLMGEEVVVTATRTPAVIKNVPIRTEVLTPVVMKKREAKTVYEALEAVPGVRVEQQCSNCNYSTLRVEGLEGGYAQTLIDGQPIFTGLAGVYGLQQMQTGNIEKIEVVKGASSALYGSDAMGGVVNIIMKEPTAIPEYNFGVNIGSYGTNHFYFNGSQRRESLGIIFSAQQDFADGIDQTGGEGAPFYDTGKDNFTDRVESNNFGVGTKVYWFNPLGDNSRCDVFARASSEFRRGGNFNTWNDPFDPDTEHIRTKRYETGITLSKEFSEGQKIDFDYSYVNHNRNATNGAAWDKPIQEGLIDNELNLTKSGESYINQFGFNNFRNNFYPKPFIVQEQLHLGGIRYSHNFNENHILLTGIQYRKSNLEQDINGSKSDKHANDVGLYVQSDFHFSEFLELVTGLRYDIHKSKDNFTGGEYNTKVLNPRLALRYTPITDMAVRASFGQGYRVPYLFAEDLHLCASAPRIFKGKDLKPERATSFSIGIDIYKIRYRLGFSIFRTNIKDKVEFISPEDAPVPEGFDYRWTNFGDAHTQGFEGTVAGLCLHDNLEYNFNFIYTDARFNVLRYTKEEYPTENDGWKNSDHIPRSPLYSGNASLTYTMKNGWMVYGSIDYTGSMFIDHVPQEDTEKLIIEKTDGFFLLGAKLSKRINEKMSIFIGGKNLLNYTQPKRDKSDPAYIYGPLFGRIVYSGFDINLK